MLEQSGQIQFSMQNGTAGSTPMQIQLEKIGGSNNSTIFELFRVNPNDFPQKRIPLEKVLKTVSHTCADPHRNNSQLKIHRRECFHLSNEAQILSQLCHESIIKVQQHINDDRSYCGIILPKASCDLYQLLKSKSNVPIQYLKLFFQQILSAINHMHQQKIAHNDIKLANLFFMQKQSRMILADFGFAQKNDEESLNALPNMGKDQYERWYNRTMKTLSPEMIQKIKDLDQISYVDELASDMFSFGITLFEAIFLLSPFQGEYASPDDDIFGPFFSNNSQDIIKFWSNPQIVPRLMHYRNIPESNLSQLMDLLTKIFNIDPQQRITAVEALQHPWFQ